VDRPPDGTGGAKYDHVTLLVFISFAVSDLDERSPEPGS